MFLFAFVFTTVVVGVAWFQFKYGRLRKLGNCFPGPPTWPIFGNAQYFINKPVEENLRILRGFFNQYGETVRIWLGLELQLFFQNQKDLEVIMSGMSFTSKADVYQLMKPWLNEGLLISKGKKWHNRRKIITPGFHFKILTEYLEVFEKQGSVFCKILGQQLNKESFDLYELVNRYTMDVITGKKWFRRRKIITPAFHFKILEQYIEVFGTQSDKLVENLRSQMNNESFDLHFYVNLCTLDTICESAMGVSVNAQTNTDSEYVKAVKTISTVVHKRMFDILYRFDFTFMFTQLAREEKKALNTLHSFTENIIVQRREEILREKENKSQQHIDDVGVKRKMAFLDILLQSEIDGKSLSNLDIREEVDTFMFEGHDTTSSAITFFFYNVALYQDAQKKCFEEIYHIFGNDKTKPATFEDLNNLHYIELCIKETLRLFPSVPLLGRKVTEECEINGKLIPAGTNIGISPLHLGRSEEIFPKAKEFIPERFDVGTNTERMNPYAFIPFSAGPRNCIGQKFAMLEIKSVIVNVLRNFEVEYVGTASGELLLIGELVLRTRDPLMFKVKQRVYN